MRDLAHLVALLEMRDEQLQLHLGFVRAGSMEARKIRSLLATIRMRKRALQEFTADASRAPREMTFH
jgi:hypothetical protein